MTGISSAACSLLTRQIRHLNDLACALYVIAGEAVTVMEDDNAPLAAGLRGAALALCNQVDQVEAELKKMQGDPQWSAGG